VDGFNGHGESVHRFGEQGIEVGLRVEHLQAVSGHGIRGQGDERTESLAASGQPLGGNSIGVGIILNPGPIEQLFGESQERNVAGVASRGSVSAQLQATDEFG